VFCEICRNHYHQTATCRYKNTILDPTPENLFSLGITRADTVIANFCRRKGLIQEEEIYQVRTLGQWQQLAEEVAERTPTDNLPQNQTDTDHTMVPNDYDQLPIFGFTTVEKLQSSLNQQLLDLEHQQRAAALTLKYHGFIRKAKPHQGINKVPMPLIDWLNQTNMGALRTTINEVVSESPPSREIPPTSTLILQAALCQLLVVKGANFKTQIQVNVIEPAPKHYEICYTLAFTQNRSYNLTATMENETEFLDDTGLCCIPLMTLVTQSDHVLAAATTGEIFTKACQTIVTYVLAKCHDTHFSFAKWVLEPGSAQFHLIPNAPLTHTARILATLLQDIMPENHINSANDFNPQSTHYVNHTDRPHLRIVMNQAYRQNMGQHDMIWNITLHIINTTQIHPDWIEHSTLYADLRTTDTAASSSTTLAPSETAPPQCEEPNSAPLGQCRIIDAAGATVTQPAPLGQCRIIDAAGATVTQLVQGAPRPASSGPTTTKAPPIGVVIMPVLSKPSPPHPPAVDAPFSG